MNKEKEQDSGVYKYRVVMEIESEISPKQMEQVTVGQLFDECIVWNFEIQEQGEENDN